MAVVTDRTTCAQGARTRPRPLPCPVMSTEGSLGVSVGLRPGLGGSGALCQVWESVERSVRTWESVGGSVRVWECQWATPPGSGSQWGSPSGPGSVSRVFRPDLGVSGTFRPGLGVSAGHSGSGSRCAAPSGPGTPWGGVKSLLCSTPCIDRSSLEPNRRWRLSSGLGTGRLKHRSSTTVGTNPRKVRGGPGGGVGARTEVDEAEARGQ